ncbi:carbon monoxide dehydrogenase (plasmid) [Halococcus dombrowskii]|uniref:Carbon monoxide dehydrogenase n=1 Tax=Halococcus dombrowskii TaxID=179637 RepID=A0AAV3SKD5_HALDO|nr:SRPBCC domain-containing protein [Halococcus dombrowskii]UOO97007.1 carbon monoxide dehydrogenase [Halococcus dombrowskii]
MEFSGTFELEDTTTEEVWLALSDPVMIESALPGCQFLVEVDDTDVDFDELREEYGERDVEPTADPEVIAERAFEEGNHYAAVIQISIGPVNPTFETVVTIEERDQPYMEASGEGSAGDSSFEMTSWMDLTDTDDGVEVDWNTEADVFGRIAGMGQRVINPAANQVVKRFFSSVQDEIREREIAEGGEVDAAESNDDDRGIVDRILGRSEGN